MCLTVSRAEVDEIARSLMQNAVLQQCNGDFASKVGKGSGRPDSICNSFIMLTYVGMLEVEMRVDI